ncbi:WecB/TagA/CpsF family glycosyltransferase [Paenibacillus azoreducens]|uniref:N-acetylglucosaminyldiphosphoundecaprenol N-acetyl-beta-D-mannosaminyltransferase n=1 Tax=Paenibacillus azoreducens TaxID=116718 RepID=A0A919YC39_9BACL|nr:WecB/TagA/CpsF family glycosyltransferase [Paenibacillus azoreducens]GIO48876.1 acetylglucosaminyldiphosphoundecaprenol acetyl-beta-D-mannosaminyltransferase [Paenibacillus azoreducens]
MDKGIDTVNQFEQVPTVSIYGLQVCKWGMEDTVKYLTQVIESEEHRPFQVITANPIMVMKALEEPDYMRVMKNAELLVPDGTGVVWAASKVGTPVQERVAGFDLLHELMRVGENYHWKVFLLGSTPEVIQAAAERLHLQYPGVEITGYRDGYFKSDQDAEVIAQIREAAPDMLFVARGADTQEPWIAQHKKELGVPLMMGVGGSFDVISGKTKRAPKLFQKLRAEWLYRLLTQPTRAARMLALPKFALKVLRDKENVTKPR